MCVVKGKDLSCYFKVKFNPLAYENVFSCIITVANISQSFTYKMAAKIN